MTEFVAGTDAATHNGKKVRARLVAQDDATAASA